MNGVYWTPGMTIEHVEKLVIIECLKYTNGDKVKTAGMLGITPPTIRSKITIYQIDVALVVGKKAPAEVVSGSVGHGHVYERPDGAKARCGGPGFCQQCSQDKFRQEMEERANARQTHVLGEDV